MKLEHLCLYPLALCLTTVFFSCSSSEVALNLSAEERFELGMKKVDDGDYLDAIQDFQAITTQYQGSAVADDAQYYLGECRFRRGEYQLSAHEYELLKKNMPASPFVGVASYKIGLSYYNLSPKPSLDQDYTKKAIEEFQSFVEYFPTHEFVPDAESKIQELNNKLAQKDYDTAILYMKMENYKSANLYFESVLEKFHDSEYAERAHLGKIQALVARKKFDDALTEIVKFHSRYPNSEYKNDVKRLETLVNNQLKDRSAMNYNVAPKVHVNAISQ